MGETTATGRVTKWLAALDAALAGADIAAASGLFDGDCYWRDLVAFTWNIATLEGKAGIAAMLAATLPGARPGGFRIEGEASAADGVTEAWFTFETAASRGRGHLRLKGDKGWTLLTTMTELKGFEEQAGATRGKGVEHGIVPGRKTC